MAETCSHLDQIREEIRPKTPEGCEECLKMGDDWIHLRLCLSCGHVGCCDQSKNRHATKQLPRHPAPAHPVGRGGRGLAVVLRRWAVDGARVSQASPWPEIPYEAWRETRDTLHMYTQ